MPKKKTASKDIMVSITITLPDDLKVSKKRAAAFKDALHGACTAPLGKTFIGQWLILTSDRDEKTTRSTLSVPCDKARFAQYEAKIAELCK